ncbi:MAG: WYL domain-containing protein [Lachnospiraceae bacterium]|nr:WYL domain-containing protein [Lachnospiraceae bacterium]
MSAIRNKQRLIHLYRYLMDNTDEDHQATTNDLVDFLRREDANASRKTVKDDIEVLIEEGIDVIVSKSFYNSYFVGSRIFEVPEIKLLADGIAPNKSISGEKKRKLIGKLLSLLSIHQAEKIEKNLYYGSNSGQVSEQVYYSTDRITEAVYGGRKIEFMYRKPAGSGAASGERESERIVMTPVMIRSSGDLYYVCGFGAGGRKFEVYRLDRMTRTKVLPLKGDPHISGPALSRFLNGMFDMDTGAQKEVTLECADELTDMIRERFGENVEIRRSAQDRFYVKVSVTASPSFYGWVFRYSPKMRIISPQGVREEYAAKAREAAGIAADK